ncbi:MAG: hypothetical protein SCH66_06965, partial [Methanolobus sp.]|nr:hypothetical protein [Methanolobus sp.]
GMWLFALLRGLKASEPRLGLCPFAILILLIIHFLLNGTTRKCMVKMQKSHQVNQNQPDSDGNIAM